jgi:hypothetical protein
MMVLLRNTQTKWFYREPSQWTSDEHEAMDFQQISRAVRFALEARLENVEILLSYEDPQFNFALPINPPPQDASSHSTGSAADTPSRPQRRSKS